ncbi:MAG TPA: DnaJ domain-containing protein [Thermoanaerobaculia bacterium]|nr:DnaJ domain-containing protein [Thermoanaerobaculia bacterium]
MTNYYELLGISRHATEQDIREKFRLLARQAHPDRFAEGPGRVEAERLFQLMTEAVNVLTNEARRKAHDFDLDKGSGSGTHEPQAVAKAYLAKGVKAYKDGDFPEAVTLFDMSVQHWNKDPRALHYLAMACIKVPEKVRKGVDAIEAALKLDPMNGAAHRDAAKLYMMVGLAAKAERHLDEALKWMPDDAETRRLLAEIRPGKEPSSRIGILFGRKG